jgi:hypothetical protein
LHLAAGGCGEVAVQEGADASGEGGACAWDGPVGVVSWGCLDVLVEPGAVAVAEPGDNARVLLVLLSAWLTVSAELPVFPPLEGELGLPVFWVGSPLP